MIVDHARPGVGRDVIISKPAGQTLFLSNSSPIPEPRVCFVMAQLEDQNKGEVLRGHDQVSEGYLA